jgi:pimeloyl-ACP methyl ester carboxylesterase
MGEGNIAEVAAARNGRERLTAYCRDDADGIMAASPVQLADAFRPQLSEVDSQVLTGELAAFLLKSMTAGLAAGVEGWVDDDYAFLVPWGFDVEAVEVPVLVWQGERDRLVPAAHARWLRRHVAGAEVPVLLEDGHLTLFAERVGEVHEWLRDRLN